jgi:glutamate--cysteine ligase regulatory subunit
LILYAKQQQIELLTHNDCTNILPRGTLRQILGSGEEGSGVLAGNGNDEGLRGDVEPQWVVKYTAVVKDRGVVESKGYFAVAELRDS